MRIDHQQFRHAWFALLAAIIFIGASLLTGCNQQRYQPAKWRRSARPNATTLPSGTLPGTTLPSSNRLRGTTLPYRGTTLPNRGTTLPFRGTTLPQRGTTLPAGK